MKLQSHAAHVVSTGVWGSPHPLHTIILPKERIYSEYHALQATTLRKDPGRWGLRDVGKRRLGAVEKSGQLSPASERCRPVLRQSAPSGSPPTLVIFISPSTQPVAQCAGCIGTADTHFRGGGELDIRDVQRTQSFRSQSTYFVDRLPHSHNTTNHLCVGSH